MMKPPGSHGGNATQRCQAAVQNQPHGQQCPGQLMAPAKEGEEGAECCRLQWTSATGFLWLKGLVPEQDRSAFSKLSDLGAA